MSRARSRVDNVLTQEIKTLMQGFITQLNDSMRLNDHEQFNIVQQAETTDEKLEKINAELNLSAASRMFLRGLYWAFFLNHSAFNAWIDSVSFSHGSDSNNAVKNFLGKLNLSYNSNSHQSTAAMLSARTKKAVLETVMMECILPNAHSKLLSHERPKTFFNYFSSESNSSSPDLANIFREYLPTCGSSAKEVKKNFSAKARDILSDPAVSYQQKYYQLKELREEFVAQKISSKNFINRMDFAMSKLAELQNVVEAEVYSALVGKYIANDASSGASGKKNPRRYISRATALSHINGDLVEFFNYQARDWQNIPTSNHPHVIILKKNEAGYDFVMTDPHGHFEFIPDQIAKLEANDRLFICGDLTDRGPDSFKIIQALIQAKRDEKQVFCVRGNHEDLVLNVLKFYSKNPALIQGLEDAGALDRWKSLVNECPYPLSSDSANRVLNFAKDSENLAAIDTVPKKQIRAFWEAAGVLLQNGGAWIFNLTSEERAQVESYMSNLPYVIHVAGEFNIVHAAMPSYEILMGALDHGFTPQECEYMTWARPKTTASPGDVVADPKISRTPIVTYSGHCSFDGSEEFYLQSNAIDADFGTFASHAMIVINHTRKTIEIRCQTQEALNNLESNEDFQQIIQSISNSFVAIWNAVNSAGKITAVSEPEMRVVNAGEAVAIDGPKMAESNGAKQDMQDGLGDASQLASPPVFLGKLARSNSDTALLSYKPPVSDIDETTSYLASQASEEMLGLMGLPTSTYSRRRPQSWSGLRSSDASLTGPDNMFSRPPVERSASAGQLSGPGSHQESANSASALTAISPMHAKQG